MVNPFDLRTILLSEHAQHALLIISQTDVAGIADCKGYP